jgi:hypothetical protein
MYRVKVFSTSCKKGDVMTIQNIEATRRTVVAQGKLTDTAQRELAKQAKTGKELPGLPPEQPVDKITFSEDGRNRAALGLSPGSSDPGSLRDYRDMKKGAREASGEKGPTESLEPQVARNRADFGKAPVSKNPATMEAYRETARMMRKKALEQTTIA